MKIWNSERRASWPVSRFLWLGGLCLVTAIGVMGVPSPVRAQAAGTTAARAPAAAPTTETRHYRVADPTRAFGPDILALPELLPDVPVTGAPYSAEAVTEMTQTLADGNRIARTVTAAVSRDSEGRTRRDQRLAALGPWMPEAQPHTVLIEDPVAHVSYLVDDEQRTAIKLPFVQGIKMAGPAGAVFGTSTMAGSEGATIAFSAEKMEVEAGRDAGGDKGHIVKFAETHAFASKASDDMAPVERHELGKQMIEGVEAVGTQSVTTIPAGAIGNEQPIRIVSEQWYAEALRTVVLSKRSDPRVGEVVYRLTNVDRSDPPLTLFQVPADYTIKDVTQRDRRVRTKAEP